MTDSDKLGVPWHVGFRNEIADRLRPGEWQPNMVRYTAVNICAANGRHVAWACSQEHAEMIVAAVNSTYLPAPAK